MKKRQFKNWKIKEIFHKNKNYIGKVLGLLLLLGIIIVTSIYSVKWTVDSYNKFVATKSIPIPGPFIIDLTNFDGTVVDESKLNITGVIIEKGEDLEYFKKGIKNSTSESILACSNYGYNENAKRSGGNTSSKAYEYVLGFSLYNVVDGSCNRYERFDHSVKFYCYMGSQIYNLFDEMIIYNNAIVINVNQYVNGFWPLFILLFLLKAGTIFLFILWFRKSLNKFITKIQEDRIIVNSVCQN